MGHHEVPINIHAVSVMLNIQTKESDVMWDKKLTPL